MKKTIVGTKKQGVFTIRVGISLDYEEEYTIEAESEEEAILEAEEEFWDSIDPGDYSESEVVSEDVATKTIYSYELDSGEYSVKSAELIDYSIVSNTYGSRQPFKPEWFTKEGEKFLFKPPGKGVGTFSDKGLDIYGVIDEEAYVIPYISIALSDEFSNDEKEEIRNAPKITLNGTEFLGFEGNGGERLFVPAVPIGVCAFRKDTKAEDANEYEASDVKKMIDQWARSI